MLLHGDPNIVRAAQFALLVLLYLEQTGLVSERFSQARQAAWRGMMPYLRELDLFELGVRDGVRANPHLFAAFRIDLSPVEEIPLKSNSFDRSSLIAEVPNGCGYPSLLLCEACDFLDPAHNLRIFVDGTNAEMLAAWAMVLLTGQLAPPPGRIISVSATEHAALRREAFDAALIYQPVGWLSPHLKGMIAAKEFITL